MNSSKPLVSGVIVLARPIVTPETVVHVLVEEVSRADAAAPVVARLDFRPVETGTGGNDLEFAVPLPARDRGKRYAVRVHVDCAGSGQVAPGDQISTQSHPVPVDGGVALLVVPLSVV